MPRKQLENWVGQPLWLTPLLPVAQTRRVQSAFRAGRLRRIREGVYTAQPEETWPRLLRHAWLDVAAALFPGAVVSGRSAFEAKIVDDSVFLTYQYDRKLEVAGLHFISRKGHGALPADMRYRDCPLYWASQPRLMLENLTVSRGTPRRNAGREAVQGRLRTLLETRGERELNRLRDDAADIAAPLGLQSELQTLRKLISALLATHDGKAVPTGTASGSGHPYDARRLELFDTLASHLRSRTLAPVPDVAIKDDAISHFALLEAYFSNYIEGTKFTIEEAIAIGMEGKLPLARPKDAHDLLGVFHLAENRLLRQAVAPVGPSIAGYLEEMHQVVLRNRPEVDPGKFKLVANQAGGTTFVLPELVRGTLIAGSARLAEVPEGLSRAILTLFIVSEVHPFRDGNGRISRLVMNAELTRAGQCRVIVPTLVREEFFDTLRLMSRSAEPKALVDFIERMQRWTAKFPYDSLDEAVSSLALCNAMEESAVRYRLLDPV